ARTGRPGRGAAAPQDGVPRAGRRLAARAAGAAARPPARRGVRVRRGVVRPGRGGPARHRAPVGRPGRERRALAAARVRTVARPAAWAHLAVTPRVLYVNHTAQVSGGERSLIELLAALDGRVEPIVAVPP